MFSAIAEFERDLIGERTNAGLEAARARGKKGGRKRVLSDKQISIGKSLAADKSRSVEDICSTLKISPATIIATFIIKCEIRDRLHLSRL